MNKNKKTFLKLGTLALILGSLGVAGISTEAYRGDINVKGPNFSEERHAEMVKALESKDYEAWKNLMQGRGRVTEVVNKDNFDKFVDAYKLAKNGDIEGAKKIRQELGLGLKNGNGRASKEAFGKGFGQGFRNN